MSVLNVAFHPDAIHLLSDTLAYLDGKPYSLVDRKVRLSEAGRFAYGSRGSTLLGDVLDDVLGEAGDTDTAIAVAEAFPGLIPSAVLDQYLRKGFEITVAGWSERAGDLVVRRVVLDDERRLHTVSLNRGVILQPVGANPPALPPTVSERQMVRLALAQHAIQDRLDAVGLGRICVGGVMHLTTITRAGAVQRIVATYPDYHQHAKEFGDPIADEVSEFLATTEAEAA